MVAAIVAAASAAAVTVAIAAATVVAATGARAVKAAVASTAAAAAGIAVATGAEIVRRVVMLVIPIARVVTAAMHHAGTTAMHRGVTAAAVIARAGHLAMSIEVGGWAACNAGVQHLVWW